MIAVEDIPDDANGDVLRGMRANGDSLTQPRPIDFSVVFPTERAVLAFCEAVAERGAKIAYEENSLHENRPWDVTVTREMAPSHAEIGRMEVWLAAQAEPRGGINDGWGCFNINDLPNP